MIYDAIVVGARVAGAPTAMLLARRGRSVLLLDRATFPSDTLSTHLITPDGVARLRQWGLLDRLLATGCPPIRSMKFDYGIMAMNAPFGEAVFTVCPRRTVLDALLVDAARETGAEVRTDFSVRGLLRAEDGRVNGIRGSDAQGAEVEVQAQVVIGADGANSFVAREVGATEYDLRPGTSCGYYSYWSGIPDEGASLHMRDQRIFLVFPTHDQRTCVAQQAPAEEFGNFRADIAGGFDAALDQIPALAARVRAGRREERFAGLSPRPSLFRRAWGSGWALAGDAGCYKDPVTGSGIGDAFRDADLLSAALDRGLSGQLPLDEALAGYAVSRDAGARPGFEAACLLSSFTPMTPAFLQRIGEAMSGPPPPAGQPA